MKEIITSKAVSLMSFQTSGAMSEGRADRSALNKPLPLRRCGQRIFLAAARALMRRKSMSSVLPENAYDEPPPEPPAIIIVASMTSTGDSAPMRSCERSYMEPKNLGVCCAVMPVYFRVVSYYTCIIRATSLTLSTTSSRSS